MLRKLLSLFILGPIVVLLVALCVVNKDRVTVALDPLGATGSTLVWHPRVFELSLALLTLGVIVGGIATWLGQAKWRRRARRLERELAAARAEADRLRAQPPIVPLEAAPRALRPPAA
ncbi:MAG TPA: lipopolysaccharide assembly protein LapA domain-containing protein [Xanthobacteraceae bacterium]|nr:lipopolysaccharide assembly protein LapA domain-containing protein [Xanthobacteraceae bacterium]